MREKKDCACPRARHQHGTWLAYACDDCRCPPCKAANGAYDRDKRKRRYLAGGALSTNGAGTARRLQALAVIGFGSRELAEICGHATPFSIERWRLGAPLVTLESARRVREMYEQLWDQRPTGRYTKRTARWALSLGWVPPLAWDDDTIDDPNARPNLGPDAHRYGVGRPTASVPDVVDDIAVERAIRGDRVRLTAAEKAIAVATLTRWGLSAAQIAQRIGTSERLVTRKRAAA